MLKFSIKSTWDSSELLFRGRGAGEVVCTIFLATTEGLQAFTLKLNMYLKEQLNFREKVTRRIPNYFFCEFLFRTLK